MTPNYSIYKSYSRRLAHDGSLTLLAAETDGNNEFECTINLTLTIVDGQGCSVYVHPDNMHADDMALIRNDMARMLQEQMAQDSKQKEEV